MELNSFLNDLGLGELLPVFQAAEVDFDVLERLTDSDLKELGVTQLGARRKILFALEKTIPINRMDLIAALEEKEIYRREISEKQIVVTSHRISIGENSLLLGVVRSASVYTHAEPDRKAEEKWSKIRAGAYTRLVGGISILTLSLAAIVLISKWYQLLFLLFLGAVPGLTLLISGLRRIRAVLNAVIRPLNRYYLRIETSTGPNDMLMSVNKKDLDEIVQSISQAMGK